jgi:hypothetical protein
MDAMALPQAARAARATPRVDASPLRVGDLDVGGLRLLPRRLGTPPVPRQDAPGLHRGVEDVQAVLQGRGRRGVAARSGDPRDRLGDPLGGIGDDELQAVERRQALLPGLTLAVCGVRAEDGGHARRLDADQRRSPPKKISSSASVRARGMHAASNGTGTPLALVLELVRRRASKDYAHLPHAIPSYTGMRRGEVLRLRWDDVEFDQDSRGPVARRGDPGPVDPYGGWALATAKDHAS